MSASRTEHIAGPISRYLVALIARQARSAEVTIEVYAQRIAAQWQGSASDLEAFKCLARDAEAVE